MFVAAPLACSFVTKIPCDIKELTKLRNEIKRSRPLSTQIHKVRTTFYKSLQEIIIYLIEGIEGSKFVDSDVFAR